MVKIAPSVLSADFSCLKEELAKVEEAEWIHVDVMDGHFVPNITIGPLVVKALSKITKQFLDVHLMIDKPENYIKDFASAGADLITIHAEACKNINKLIRMIRKNKCKVGVSIRPKTSLKGIKKILDKVDVVLVMTVEPGFGGQKFISEVLPKIRELKMIKENKDMDYEIEVDGGINRYNCGDVVKAGAEILVSGSAIFKSKDPAEELRDIRDRADKVLNKTEK